MIRVRLGRAGRGMGVIAGQAEKGGQRFMGAVEVARGWSPGMSVMSQTETLQQQSNFDVQRLWALIMRPYNSEEFFDGEKLKLSAVNRSGSHGDELASATVQFPPKCNGGRRPSSSG